jgi:hypothetical protein
MNRKEYFCAWEFLFWSAGEKVKKIFSKEGGVFLNKTCNRFLPAPQV